MRLIEPRRFHWMSAVTLGGMLACWPAGAMGQGTSPSAPPTNDLPRVAAPSSDAHQELLDRLARIEQRLDQVTKQNEDLARANKTLAGQVHDLSSHITYPAQQGGMTGAMQGAGSS